MRTHSTMRLAIAVATVALAAAGTASAHRRDDPSARHVLLLSVDGLHQSDLAYYVKQHPSSALAKLANRGVQFTHAETPVPSDSFPGMVGQVTGGNPSSTGVYYDDTWNHALLPAGTINCARATPAPRSPTSSSSTRIRSRSTPARDWRGFRTASSG